MNNSPVIQEEVKESTSQKNIELLDKVIALWNTDPQLDAYSSTSFKNAGPFKITNIQNESSVQIKIDSEN